MDRDDQAMPDGAAAPLTRVGGDHARRGKVSPATLAVLADVGVERERQRLLVAMGKFPWDCSSTDVPDNAKLPVLAEEVGEVAHALLYVYDPETFDYGVRLFALRDELVQVAAVAVAWAEAVSAQIDGGPVEEPAVGEISPGQIRAFHAMCRVEDDLREQTLGEAKRFWKARYDVAHVNDLTYEQARRLLDELDLTLQELGAPRHA